MEITQFPGLWYVIPEGKDGEWGFRHSREELPLRAGITGGGKEHAEDPGFCGIRHGLTQIEPGVGAPCLQ